MGEPHLLRPYEIDSLTLAQVYLYCDDDEGEARLPMSEIKAKVRAMMIGKLKERIVGAGRHVPNDLEQWEQDRLKSLWDELEPKGA